MDFTVLKMLNNVFKVFVTNVAGPLLIDISQKKSHLAVHPEHTASVCVEIANLLFNLKSFQPLS